MIEYHKTLAIRYCIIHGHKIVFLKMGNRTKYFIKVSQKVISVENTAESIHLSAQDN